MNILETFNPVLTSALERFQRFKDPEPRDLQKIFGPALSTICNVAGVDSSRAASLIDTWDPAAVTMETLHSAVRELNKPAMLDMELARAKTAALSAEIDADIAAHPPTERQKLQMMRRNTPLSERSRDSIEAEMYELNSCHVRIWDPNYNEGQFRCGEELSHAVLMNMPHTLEELRQELDRRDCEADGVEYQPPAKVEPRDYSLDMVRPMRG